MTFAQVYDVEVDFGTISEDDLPKVEALLVRAEARIKQEIPNLEDQVSDGSVDRILVVQVESEMAAAVLRNPNCWQSQTEAVGPFSKSHTVNLALASGLLELTDRHRSLLGIRSRSGSIAPLIGWLPGQTMPYPDYRNPLRYPGDGWA